VTVSVLILMVFVAGFQAFVRNLTRFDVQWANEMLTDMDWADSLMRKGTLWLAFLGASLATHKHKHIGIDILLRIAPPRAKYTMLATSSVLAGLIALGLTVSFSSAVRLNLTERPLEYEILGPEGSMHICDATKEQLDKLVDLEKPTFFCAMRSALSLVGVPAETPGAAFQLIVPLMFVAIAIRLMARGASATATLLGGDEALELAEAEEKRRMKAEQESAASMATASELAAKRDGGDGGGAS